VGVELRPEWVAHRVSFTCDDDCANARIHLDLGRGAGSVEVRRVCLVDDVAGAVIRPALPPPYLPAG
jgi:hypothetical protein